MQTLVDKLGTVMPARATSLIDDSLTQMTQKDGAGAALLGIGGLLALWSLGGAMQNVMWALDAASDRDETRGFVNRRFTAWAMLGFAIVGFALAFGLLVLGPPLSTWLGNAIGEPGLVKAVWWVAQWPVLVSQQLVAYAGLLYLGPDVEHPRWKFLSLARSSRSRYGCSRPAPSRSTSAASARTTRRGALSPRS